MESIIGIVLLLYFMVFFVATGWELIYEIV
jgi:hypothetical protein